MQFKVGDIIRNKLTHEAGRIVRITDSKQRKDEVAYVVSVCLDPRWGETEIEALWIQSEVSGVPLNSLLNEKTQEPT
jgi:hypothetical protein